MKSEEDKFRESLRSIIESREFPFAENDWDRAGAYISRKRWSRRFRVAGLFLLVSSGAALLFLTVPANDRSTVAQASPSVTAGETLQPDQITIQNNSVEKLGNNGPAQVPEVSAPAKVKVRMPAGRVTENTQPEADKPRFKPGTATAGAFEMNFSATTTNPGSDISDDASGKKSPESDISPKAETEPEINRDPVSPVAVENIVNAGQNEEAVTENKDGENEEINTAEAAAVTETSATQPAAMDPLPSDVAVAVAGSNASDSAVRTLAPYLTLEAGADFLAGWQSGTREGNGLSPVFGIHYASVVTSNVRLSVGAQYNRIGNLSAYTHTSAVTVLSFGEESEVTRITPRKLHYAGAALRLTYELNKNAFGLGYSIGYLFDVQSDVETYSFVNNEKTNVRNFTSRGYADGFRMFDSRLSLIYRRALLKRITLHAEIFSGLSDLKEDGFFLQQGSQRPLGARLAISYQLNGQ